MTEMIMTRQNELLASFNELLSLNDEKLKEKAPDIAQCVARLVRETALLEKLTLADENAPSCFDKALEKLLERCKEQCTPDTFIEAHPDLLDAIYVVKDYNYRQFEITEDTDQARRAAHAQEMLHFLKNRLRPALKARKKLREEKGLADDREPHLACRHHWLCWQSARDAHPTTEHQTGGWSSVTAANCLQLANDYDSIPNPHAAANATSGGIDCFLDVFRRRPDQLVHLNDSLSTLCENLELRVNALGSEISPEVRLDLWRRCAEGYIAIKDSQSATRILGHVLEVFGQNVDVDIMQQYSDYLGIALALDRLTGKDGGPGDQFIAMYRVTREHEYEETPTNDADIVVRAHIYRTCAMLGVADQDQPRWNEIQSAHELATSLDRFRAQCNEDLTHLRENGTSPTSMPQWNALILRLGGQIGKVLTNCPPKAKVLIEPYEHAVQVPWPGLVLSKHSADAIRLRIPNESNGPLPQSPAQDDGILFVNEAPEKDKNGRPDRLQVALREYAKGLSLQYETTGSVGGLRQKLEQFPAKLIIIGCHGDQEHSRRELRLQIGGERVPALKILTGLRLPRASTVLCLVCFSGGGQFYVNGQWDSLPSMFLRAGARTVVATTWPAWLESPTTDWNEAFKPHHFQASLRMMQQLRDKSCSDDIWEIPRVVTRWMSEQAEAKTAPRVWAGWSVWTV